MRLFSDCFYHVLKLRSVVLDSGGMGETVEWVQFLMLNQCLDVSIFSNLHFICIMLITNFKTKITFEITIFVITYESKNV